MSRHLLLTYTKRFSFQDTPLFYASIPVQRRLQNSPVKGNFEVGYLKSLLASAFLVRSNSFYVIFIFVIRLSTSHQMNYQTISIALLILCLPQSEANDEAIRLGLKQVELSKDLNGWKPVTQSKQIRYGEWTTNAPIGQVGTGGGWGNWGTSVVWEDYKTVTSNEFERASLNNGENGLRIQSIEPFVPSNATKYYQEELGSFIISPRIDLSTTTQDSLFFQYKSNTKMNLEIWISKDQDSYWGIWEENPNRFRNHISATVAENDFTQIKINLHDLLIEMGQIFCDNERHDAVINPETNEVYIAFVAYDNAERRLGSDPEMIEIKSIWTSSYYSDGQLQPTPIDPVISFDHKCSSVTISGRVGETYELQTSSDLDDWKTSHSFTLETYFETYPISDFQNTTMRTMFFRLKHKP